MMIFREISIEFGCHSAIIVGTLNASKVCHSGLSGAKHILWNDMARIPTHSKPLSSKRQERVYEKIASIDGLEIYVLICSHSIKWNSVRCIHFVWLALSIRACLSLVAGLLVIKGKSNEIGLRVVNGVTCTSQWRMLDGWDMMFSACVQFHPFFSGHRGTERARAAAKILASRYKAGSAWIYIERLVSLWHVIIFHLERKRDFIAVKLIVIYKLSSSAYFMLRHCSRQMPR